MHPVIEIVSGVILLVASLWSAGGNRSKTNAVRNTAISFRGSITQRISNVVQSVSPKRQKSARDWLSIALGAAGVVLTFVGLIHSI
jgi:hypothetical protein